MSTILPESEKIRRAVRWISDQLNENPGSRPLKWIEPAAIRFDLNPQETDFLIQFYRNTKHEKTED